MTTDLKTILNDLDDEIARSKSMINEKGYHNGTVLNAIVRDYRTALKKYRKIVADDLHVDGVQTYESAY